jgi:uncharacterized repeat protein (TIGR01451 family)
MPGRGIHKLAIPIALVGALALGSTAALAADAGAGDATSPTTGSTVAAPGMTIAVHGGQAKAKPRASARLAACRRAVALDGRSAAVLATMRPIRHGKHLSLRVDLVQRPLAGGHWSVRTDVPGLGTWIAPNDAKLGSRPGDVFKYRQAVGQLVIPFAYRFKVSFRWSNASGAVVRRAHVTTQPCREFDPRPDLVLPSVTTAPVPQNLNALRYSVTVRNAGNVTARGVVVSASFPGNETASGQTRTVALLGAGASTKVTFGGPPCASLTAPPTFTVDPSSAIDELDETNNQLTATCPAP